MKYNYRTQNGCNNCHNMRLREDSYTSNGFMQEHVTFALYCDLLSMKVLSECICDAYKLLDQDLRNKEREEEEKFRGETYSRLFNIMDKLL